MGWRGPSTRHQPLFPLLSPRAQPWCQPLPPARAACGRRSGSGARRFGRFQSPRQRRGAGRPPSRSRGTARPPPARPRGPRCSRRRRQGGRRARPVTAPRSIAAFALHCSSSGTGRHLHFPHLCPGAIEHPSLSRRYSAGLVPAKTCLTSASGALTSPRPLPLRLILWVADVPCGSIGGKAGGREMSGSKPQREQRETLLRSLPSFMRMKIVCYVPAALPECLRASMTGGGSAQPAQGC